MKISKNYLLKKAMKMVGSLSLLLAALVIVPTSTLGGYQPKCPDELLK
ncbi:cyclic lactone autoinducer peptide [Clostridium algifaecis]|uniref:Cyclic lactone autoinducer peptide n=1 Tax=Clostridium algifaecis TaxID=1472040 RepID=A0ABS4KPB4_9CLOT|nr:cyclic lactone autoinducer peptide [Clostridium algifaecis]MBP2031891.1 cyclic lactone autoinducer peptide [Clostridium algifaecis]MBP2033899.1 cyclic lactone autoinducer peptide [Clostridium algifaecis]